MQSKRYLLRWLFLPLIIVGMGWQLMLSPAQPTSMPASRQILQFDSPYIINVDSEEAFVELPFYSDSNYDLIISSLGDAEQKYEVSLTSEVIQKSSTSPLQQLGTLQVPNKKSSWIRSESKLKQQSIALQTASKQRTFRLHVTDGSLNDPAQYFPVPARIVGEGKQVRVYLDEQSKLRDLSTGLVDEIIELFDNKIVPGFQKQIGTVRDVDNDGKFTILLTPWLGKLQGGKTSLDGFVRGCDFDPNVRAPFGHQCDMMYLNSRLKPGKHLQSLLAHEFTHAILFSSRMQQVGATMQLRYEEDWLNESIAHLGENLQGDGWSNLDYRISRFLESPQKYPLVVEDYYSSGMWRNHGCRGATYLFLRWVVDQYGIEILPQLIQSPVNGTRNIEHVTGTTFTELFRRWNIAMLMSQQNESSINLWGELGSWNLTGVATQQWDVSRKTEKKIIVRGTASTFLHFEKENKQQSRRIHIQADAGTQLQVTLIKRHHHKDFVKKVSGVFNGKVLQTKINYNPSRCRIEKISVEANEGNMKESICFQKDSLSIGKNNSHQFKFPLPRRFQKSGTKLLIKTVAIDRRGYRSVTRQTVIR